MSRTRGISLYSLVQVDPTHIHARTRTRTRPRTRPCTRTGTTPKQVGGKCSPYVAAAGTVHSRVELTLTLLQNFVLQQEKGTGAGTRGDDGV